MKKIVSLLLACALFALVFTSCGTSNAKTVASADDLPGARIGVQRGTTGDIFASDYEKPVAETDAKGATVATAPAKSTIERYSTGADAVQSLKQSKVDCVIIDENPAKAFVAKNTDLKILEEPFANEDYAICLKKGSDLTAKINAALAELKKEGTVDKIISNFIGDDTKGKNAYVTPDGTDHSKGTLIMATNAAFEPYEYKEGDNVVGIDAMLATAICDKLGYALKIEDMDFDSIIPAISSGKANFGMAGMTVNDERKKSVDFTDAYTTSKQVIIVKK